MKATEETRNFQLTQFTMTEKGTGHFMFSLNV